MTPMKNLFAAMILCLGLALPAAAENFTAVAGNISGAVQKSSGGTAWSPVRNHDKLRIGDKVKTGADGAVILTFGEGNVLALSPLTSITIADISRTGNTRTSVIHVQSGRMLAKARKLNTADSVFEVKTANASAGVRGSEVAVTVDDASTLLQILSGVFAVTVDGQSATLNAGFQMDVLASMSEPPEALAIDPAALQALQKEIRDKTEQGNKSAAMSAAEDTAVDTAQEVFEMLDRANQGSCMTVCYYWQNGLCLDTYEACHFEN